MGAADGLAGLMHCSQRNFDFVITDMLMPNCDGVEFISLLRKINPQISIIAMSGGGRIPAETYLRIASAFGIKGVLCKPLDMNTILELVSGDFAPH